MKTKSYLLFVLSCPSLQATVIIKSIVPSLPSPQPLGTPVTFSVTATDTNPGPLTFKFSTAFNNGAFNVVRNFNIGSVNSGSWTKRLL